MGMITLGMNRPGCDSQLKFLISWTLGAVQLRMSFGSEAKILRSRLANANAAPSGCTRGENAF